MRRRSSLFVALALLTLLSNACRLDSYIPGTTSKAAKDFETDLKRNVCENDARRDAVRGLFASKNINLEEDRFERATNLRFESNPNAPRKIIVGAHYDKTTLGCGAIDNWTGLVILSRLAKKRAKFKDVNFVFIAFGEEEKGLWGSTAYLNSLEKQQRDSVCAMVNLDSFGFDQVWALRSISSKDMLMLASDLRRDQGGSFSIRNYRRASSDSEPFFKADIPAITFSGLGDNWRDYLHQDADQLENINIESVVKAHSFLDAFLDRLSKQCYS